MSPGKRTGWSGDLALVAGTVLATLAVQRHLSRNLHASDSIPHQEARHASTSEHLHKAVSAKWKRLVVGTYERINRDRILATAAGVVFYGFAGGLSTALVSSYGLFSDPAKIAGNLQSLDEDQISLERRGGAGVRPDWELITNEEFHGPRRT